MSDESVQGAGPRLKSAREGMEVSTREVADALNLPIRVIEALESDDYDALPPTVFTRGYLRSYARLLELPGDELLALYPEVEADTDTSIPVVEEPSGIDASQLKLAGAAAAAFVVAIVLLVWIFSGDDDAETDTDSGVDPVVVEEAAPEAAPPTAEPDTGQMEAGEEPEASEPLEEEATAAAPAPAPAVPETVIAPEASELPPATSRTPESAERSEEVSQPDTDTEVVQPAASEQTTAQEQPGVRRITEFGDDLITFTFNDECWVEVKTLDGENLYSDLNRAGRTLSLTGRGPFRILLGYAPGVELEFNGESVPLTRYTRNNVANLVLGE